METVKPLPVTPGKSKLARKIAKVLHIRAVTGIAPLNQKVQDTGKPQEKFKDEQITAVKPPKGSWSQLFDKEDKELEYRIALEAFLAKLFSCISTIKSSYVQLQYAQSPYDAEGIQSADQFMVLELKSLSELKQCYMKKQFDFSPEKTMVSSEVQELKSLLKTYEIMRKKLESQLKLKDSEIIFLKEKLEELNKQNKSLEKRMNQSGELFMTVNLHLSGLSPSHFITALCHTVKSIRSFVRLMIDGMKLAGWDTDAAANSIQPRVMYYRDDHKCFAFESFVCREMFDAFHFPSYSPEKKQKPLQQQQQLFFQRFMDLKPVKVKEYLSRKPKSSFAKFCRAKYLQMVHPTMESACFGNFSQRNIVSSREFPDTPFFNAFSEMAKRVWLLHCLAYSLQPEASIFQVNKGCRFSEVYMESVAEEAFLSSENPQDSTLSLDTDPQVAFTIVPGFRIGKTVLQCQVYLSPLPYQSQPDQTTQHRPI